MVGESIRAFVVVTLVALTLPAGAIIARYWQGSWRTIGLMSAFGGGALIAGVAVDLVAESIEDDTYLPLTVGAVAGGLLFTALNQLINARGGFLRKASTTITYFRSLEQRRQRTKLERLKCIHWFDGLPNDELRAVGNLIEDREYDPGAHIHEYGDRTENLRIVASGAVQLDGPGVGEVVIQDDAFGTRAFLTGAPHISTAIALESSTIYQLSRDAFFDLLDLLPTLHNRIRAATEDPAIRSFLTEAQGMTDDEVDAWLEAIDDQDNLGLRAVDVTRPEPERLVELLRGQSWAEGLSARELNAIADRLYLIECADGDVLYQQGDRGDRQYFIENGEVLVVYSTAPTQARRLTAGELFGNHSFATGIWRSGIAIASGTAQVWVMRRRDLGYLLDEYPGIRQTWANYVQSNSERYYLQAAHGIDSDRVGEVIGTAIAEIRAGRLPHEMRTVTITGSAGIAIWLGILLDGIPEAIAIGANLNHGLAIALVAGMLVSNLPEALASSRGMAEQRISWRGIYLMWGGIVVASGIAGAIGALMFADASTEVRAFVNGIAGGAILTVVSETMLPESYERSGTLTGLATLFGFLVAAGIGVVLE